MKQSSSHSRSTSPSSIECYYRQDNLNLLQWTAVYVSQLSGAEDPSNQQVLAQGERESKEKGKDKKYRVKRAKKKVVESSSKSESGSDSLDSDSEQGQKKHHHANRLQACSHKTLQVLKATINHA